MNFEWMTPGRIIFGRGSIGRAGRLAVEFGRRILLVRDGGLAADSGPVEAVYAALAGERLEVEEAVVRGEPAVEAVDELVARVRSFEPEAVCGLGGGSAIDAAKAVSALLVNGGEVLDYLEVIGRGRPFSMPGIPVLAIPTTAGTGAEATRNAVLTSRAYKVKASLRGAGLMPRLALVDPALTDSLPPAITASTGLDALTQCLESYLCLKANPATDALALEGMKRASRSLLPAFRGGDVAEARDDMALAALLSGLCLTNAGLGAVHGLAAALGGLFPVPHGAACGLLLPHVLSANIRALAAQSTSHPVLVKCRRLDDILVPECEGLEGVKTVLCIDRLLEMTAKMGIPRLSSYGIKDSDLPALAAAAARTGSIKGNPVVLPEPVLVDILRAAL
ncbi:MAG: iron-containing alcohol dehydrogenase [Candidatus Aminicenantes bacterium]|nr:iron-containing alcohol dehydrogenase [Candidatus Aminicenantes bacterium]